MGILKKIINVLTPSDGKDGKEAPSKVTNKVLYKELIDHFTVEMEELSFGNRILYPMSFNILLHPDDYARVGDSLPYILPEVISGFYAAIKAKVHRLSNPDYTNTSLYWFFQFTSSQVKTTDGKDSFIQPGEIVTVGSLKTFDLKRQQGIREDNVQMSIKCQNSQVNQNNINPKALLGMEILSENAFSYQFDERLNEDKGGIQGSLRGGKNALAVLSYSDGASTIRFTMLDNLITVSGPNEKRNMDNIIVIKNQAVAVGHVQIRYVKETNMFQLCAYAKCRLNQREVPLSYGGVPVWKDMAYRSEIFLNDEVNLVFRASDAIVSRMNRP